MDNNKDYNDIDYTMVLDGGYQSPFSAVELEKQGTEPEWAHPAAKEADESKAEADRIYDKYEKMFLKDFTALDADDIYPRSYQWRAGDRYSEEKLAVVEAAIRRGKRIVDTDEYQDYIEKIKKAKFTPDSWE